jgi:hypothetical protein
MKGVIDQPLFFGCFGISKLPSQDSKSGGNFCRELESIQLIVDETEPSI